MLSVTAVEGAENRKKTPLLSPCVVAGCTQGWFTNSSLWPSQLELLLFFLDTTTCFEHMAHGVVKDVCDGQMCTFSSPCEKSSLSLSVMYTLRCHIYIYIWKHIHHIYIYINRRIDVESRVGHSWKQSQRTDENTWISWLLQQYLFIWSYTGRIQP